MASVHPSRMNLIPQELREGRQEKSRVRSPRRSPSPRQRDRDQDRDRDRRREDNRRTYDDERRSGRDRSVDRGRDSHRDRPEPRRASPQYEDYKRPPPPVNSGEAPAPWRQQESMYPPHRGGNPYGGSGGSGASFLEARRAQRDALTANPWPPSPKAPARDLSPRGKKSSKKSKRHRSPSSDATDSSEEERRRKKERKRARRAREKEERKENKPHRHHRHHSSDEEDEEDRKDRKHRSKRSRTRSPSRSRSRSNSKNARLRSRTPSKERMDVDRLRLASPTPATSTGATTSRAASKGPTKSSKNDADGESSDEELGPKPLYAKSSGKKADERSYGGALLRGEGSAMAAFLQDDPASRIPRRGEIGLTSDEIAKYEDVGYVMSGSRHRRMNAVRMRKENQVISAEEKRGILKLQREERERKEAILRDEFSQLVNEKLKATTGHTQPPT